MAHKALREVNDEKEAIINDVRPINNKLKRSEDPDTIYKVFIHKIYIILN